MQMCVFMFGVPTCVIGCGIGCVTGCVVQAEYRQAVSGSMQEAQQTATMSASLAKTNWINSGLRSQVGLSTSPSHWLSCVPLCFCSVYQAVNVCLLIQPVYCLLTLASFGNTT